MERLERARTAYERRDWVAVRQAYETAEAAGDALAAVDLEQWAYAALWRRDPDVAVAIFERAEAAYRSEGEPERAAIMALAVAQLSLWTGQHTQAGVAMVRVAQAMDGLPECEVHALVAWATAFQASAADGAGSLPLWEAAVETARRVGSTTAEAASLSDLGSHLVRHGDRDRGLQLLDQAAGLALTDDVAPLAAGHVLCGTIWAYRDLGDWRAAAEWVDVTWRWLERTRVSIFPGLCRFHRCEVMRVRGEFEAAEAEALESCRELERLYQPRAGHAYRELGEIRLRRGDLDGAETAFESALTFGVDPQPGLARLRLARGDVTGTVRGLEDALAATGTRAVADRPFVLSVLVSAAIAAGDLDRARGATDELAAIADRLGTDAHRAAAHQAAGEIALADGDGDTAHEHLHLAWQLWSRVGAPFEAATTQVLLARVAEQAGDWSQARLDLKAARGTFERIGARLELGRVDRLLARLGDTDRRELRTFLFTDIVDSTLLQSAIGDDAWMRLLSWHDRTLRSAFEAHGGVEVKHQGDGFLAVFPRPAAAVACACEIQRRLATQRANHGFAPGVRIGVHAGEATIRDGDYFGEAVTVAARIADAARGGDVWCSAATLPAEHQASEFFELELKGIRDPVRIAAVALG